MIFLSKDGKCLWDETGEAVQADDGTFMGISARDIAQHLALIHALYSRAAALLPVRYGAIDAACGCDCSAGNC